MAKREFYVIEGGLAMQTARDIMTKDVVTLSPEMPVEEAGEALTQYRIHGAPVVDATEQLVGMVSLVDLVGRTGRRVKDIMSAEPVSAFVDTPVDEIASIMLEQMVRRVPIVEGGRVVGIVSASDVIGVLLDIHEQTGEAVPRAIVRAQSKKPEPLVRGRARRPRRVAAVGRRQHRP
jgi:CBS domain-containing protein